MEGSLDKQCSRCKKMKQTDEFSGTHKLCDWCIEAKKEYQRCKREGIEKVKELKTKFEMKNHWCEICNYEIRLCKKAQHEKSLYHLDRLNRKEHPEKYENEEKPDDKTMIDGREYFQCYKCKLAILSSNWHKHILTKDHLQKTKKKNLAPRFDEIIS